MHVKCSEHFNFIRLGETIIQELYYDRRECVNQPELNRNLFYHTALDLVNLSETHTVLSNCLELIDWKCRYLISLRGRALSQNAGYTVASLKTRNIFSVVALKSSVVRMHKQFQNILSGVLRLCFWTKYSSCIYYFIYLYIKLLLLCDLIILQFKNK